jgi:hypothetical protein
VRVRGVVHRFLAPGNLVLAGATVCFAIRERSELTTIGARPAIGYWDLLVDTTVNFRFSLYLLLPLWLITLIRSNRNHARPIWLIRCGSLHAALLEQGRWALTVLATGSITVCAAVLVAAIGLPLGAIADQGSTAVSLVRLAGLAPVVAVAAQFALVTLTFTTVALLNRLLALLRIPLGAVVAVNTGLYLWFISASLGNHTDTPAWAILRLVDLQLAAPFDTLANVTVMVAAVGACLLIARGRDRRLRGHPAVRPSTPGWLVATSTVLVAVAVLRSAPADNSLSASFTVVFTGAGGALDQYLTMLWLWIGFVVGVQVSAGDRTGTLRTAELVRAGSSLRWAVRCARNRGALALSYVGWLITVAVTTYIVGGGSALDEDLPGLLPNVLWFFVIGVGVTGGSLLLVDCVASLSRAQHSRIVTAAALAAISVVSVDWDAGSGGLGGWNLGNPWGVGILSFGALPVAIALGIVCAVATVSFLVLSAVPRGTIRSRGAIRQGAP